GADTEPNTRHLSRPNVAVAQAVGWRVVWDCGFVRCDGHHKMIDLRLEKSSGLRLVSATSSSKARIFLFRVVSAMARWGGGGMRCGKPRPARWVGSFSWS